jgi:deoxyribodipyrimidine photo-lyase
MTDISLLWLRQDLRLHDQPALAAAAAEGAVVPVYTLDDFSPGSWAIGGAQRWWLHHSLARLAEALEARGGKLILRRGETAAELARFADELGTRRIHAIRHYEPWWVDAEARIAETHDLQLHDGNQLAPPREAVNGSGAAYRVYSPFFRALQGHFPPPEPVAAPERLVAPPQWPASDRLADWSLLPARPNWAGEFASAWTPGEAGALQALEAFAGGVPDYLERRNLPSQEGTSRLSAHLHFGEVSPATVYHRATDEGGDAGSKFIKELAWRDFTQAQMAAHPLIGERHARPTFDRFPWRRSEEAVEDFAAWTLGRTGYPIVDAGMRQLWRIGWIHNRVRMIVASFLVKHLLIDWRDGARWFWDTLVDADYGNNSVNWQWIAGSGFDSNQFVRIMAPLTQSSKFDAAGYIRQWVPELAGLGDDAIHDPDEHGVRPAAYPPKMIGHREARARALAAYRSVSA